MLNPPFFVIFIVALCRQIRECLCSKKKVASSAFDRQMLFCWLEGSAPNPPKLSSELTGYARILVLISEDLSNGLFAFADVASPAPSAERGRCFSSPLLNLSF